MRWGETIRLLMPVGFSPEKIPVANNRSHSLSAQIPASRLMGLDLGPLDDGLRRC